MGEARSISVRIVYVMWRQDILDSRIWVRKALITNAPFKNKDKVTPAKPFNCTKAHLQWGNLFLRWKIMVRLRTDPWKVLWGTRNGGMFSVRWCRTLVIIDRSLLFSDEYHMRNSCRASESRGTLWEKPQLAGRLCVWPFCGCVQGSSFRTPIGLLAFSGCGRKTPVCTPAPPATRGAAFSPPPWCPSSVRTLGGAVEFSSEVI